MGRVLIIRYWGQPFATRMSKVIRTILDEGWQCDVLIPQGELGTVNVSKEMGRDLSLEVGLLEFPKPSNWAQWLRRKLTAPGSIRDKLFEDYLVQLLRSKKYDVLMVKETPCLAQVFRALRRTGQQIKVVCDMYENVTGQLLDQYIHYGSWSKRAMALTYAIIPRIRRIERVYLPQCDHAFVVVDEAKSFIVQRYKVNPSRVSVVHNVELLSEFDRMTEHGEPLVDEGKILMSYVGEVASYRRTDLIIEAVARIASGSHPPFCVAIVGAKGKEFRRLSNLCQAKGLQDVVKIVEYVPYRIAMQWVKQSHIGIIPYPDTQLIRNTIANKLFQNMAGSTMSLASDVGPQGRIVRETGCGITFIPDSVDSLASQLLTAMQNLEETRAMGAMGRKWAEQRYRWELEGQLYAEYFSSFDGATPSSHEDVFSR